MKILYSAAMLLALNGFSAKAATDEAAKATSETSQQEAQQDINATGNAFDLNDPAQGSTEADAAAHPGHPGHPKGPCSQITLDDAQKATLKAALIDQKAERVTLGTALKAARGAYKTAITTAGSTQADADAAGAALATATSNLQAAKVSFKTKLLYTVFTEDQRASAFKCLSSIGHHPAGGPAGHHPGGPQHPKPVQQNTTSAAQQSTSN